MKESFNKLVYMASLSYQMNRATMLANKISKF